MKKWSFSNLYFQFSDSEAIITTPQPTPFACPAGYVAYWYACYRFIDTPATWSEAELVCQNDGAHLVSIHSEPENIAIINYNTDQLSKWIGLAVSLKLENTCVSFIKLPKLPDELWYKKSFVHNIELNKRFRVRMVWRFSWFILRKMGNWWT